MAISTSALSQWGKSKPITATGLARQGSLVRTGVQALVLTSADMGTILILGGLA